MSIDKQTNPANDDLEKDMQFEGDEYVNMEGESHSTAAEGTLKAPETTDSNTFKGNEEDSTANAVGQAKQREKEAREDGTKKTTLKEDEKLDTDEVSA